MGKMTLTKTRLVEGIWEGRITRQDGSERPNISVTHLEQPLDKVELREDGSDWVLRIPIPAHLISDGVQTFLIVDGDSGTALGSFALMSGDALGDDMRAEVDLLRAELDMLKRAFRRHCIETL